MKDPYSVLGLDKTASADQVRAAYKELHDKYSEQRFLPGEEGNEGARKLQELEEAWITISSELDKPAASTGSADYDRIDSLIRAGEYNAAQDMLDAIADRNGEWHYMQAIVFYKREWLTEAKSQLEMALREDPDNQRYRASLDKLQLAMNGGPTPPPPPQQASPYGGQYGDGQYGGGQYGGQPNDMANCLSTCCCAYCLTDCLCSAMRCC